MSLHGTAPRIRAILGPTNTGKTHRAVERMLAHPSGMMGLPLRLLAREVYDRLVAQRGAEAVALITGEQKRIPANPRYFVCTTEAMPLDRPVSFLAVDEVQLAGSPNRGHVVTDRILHARGVRETWFMGSDTIEPLLQELVPGIEVERHPRLSTLRGTGMRALGALQPRTAIVAFNAAEVYELAERIRARHGGTSVVLGALSPRARNNQVAMYQSGEVRYLVATDAIGMGLNMDVDHVAFAALEKFDGSAVRPLETPEIAQIAGRAGRYRRDGSFGTLKPLPALDPRVNEDVEQHRFPPLRRLFWRNSDLDFASPAALLDALDAPPPRPFLVQVRDWSDHEALRALLALPELRRRLTSPGALRALWEVCQIPDFRKTLTGAHVRLLARIAAHLLSDEGRLPKGWVEERIARLDRPDGDIDALMTRIAWIRTWNYVSFRGDWVDDSRGLQERCQAIEDHLSDTLHERLTERFVESRVQIVVDGLPETTPQPRPGPASARIEGLRYVAPPEAPRLHGPLRAAVVAELERRMERILAGEGLEQSPRGEILYEGVAVARLVGGASPRRPVVEVPRLELLGPEARERLRVYLNTWREERTLAAFSSLYHPAREALSPPARGLVYALEEALGALPRAQVQEQLQEVTVRDRRQLARLDVRVGVVAVYAAGLFAPDAMATRLSLAAAALGEPAPALPGGPSVAPSALPAAWATLLGYRPVGPVLLRVDAAEGLAARLDGLARRGLRVPDALAREYGLEPRQLGAVAAALMRR